MTEQGQITHGTAPKYADLAEVIPSSVILSGVMMLELPAWLEPGDLIEKGVSSSIANKTVTYDFERLTDGAAKLNGSDFGDAIIANMG